MTVDKGEDGIQALMPEELKLKSARVKQMEHIRMKIKTLKSMMTKNMNKLETAITAFEKAETQGDQQQRSKGKLRI